MVAHEFAEGLAAEAAAEFVRAARGRRDSVARCAAIRAVPTEIGPLMKTPTWIMPSLYGAGAGAIALALIGFNWGGWTTSSGADALAKKQSITAVTAALLPYCIERSLGDPNATVVLAELAAAANFGKRAVVEKAGWATPLGMEKPNTDLAQACQLALTEAAAAPAA